MSDSIKTIGVLTSGGDSPGMNAVVRAVVRRGLSKGLNVKGIRRGYLGLINEEIVDMEARSVSNVMQHGGTILETERCPEFELSEIQDKAIEICKKHGIDALVIAGGDGSFKGAQKLAHKGMNVIGIPCTIDGDISCSDYTIGFDTAVNTAMRAIDNIRDTASSHEKCSMIEVMGRNAGYIALWCGIANGAEDILLPEKYDYDEQKIIDNIIENRNRVKAENGQSTIQENQPEIEKTPEELFVERARQFVLDHLEDEDYDREALAADMGSSSSTLYNKLRAINGMNVSAFIRDIRMQEAKRIATTTPDIRISDLAYRVGFRDPRYFSTCFKKHFGMQPTEFLDTLQRNT